jgi:hypothetical protein
VTRLPEVRPEIASYYEICHPVDAAARARTFSASDGRRDVAA